MAKEVIKIQEYKNNLVFVYQTGFAKKGMEKKILFTQIFKNQ